MVQVITEKNKMEFKITFAKRAEARRFLNLSKKHPLFKMYFVSWEKRVITYKFENEEQGGIISDIIKAVLNELNVEYTVI